MSGGHSISSVSEHAQHAQDAVCIAYGQVPHGAPNKGTRTQRSLCSLLRLRLRCPFFQRIALQLFGKKGAGPLRPRECPVDIRSAACPSMHSMRRTPDAQHTGKSLMARQTETLIERWVFLFVCISIKGTRTQCSICFCELLYFILCFQIVVIYNILILN